MSTLAAHPSGHPHALEDAGRRCGGADRARLANVVRAVREAARVNLWRLIVPWKPLPIETPETLILSPGSNAPTVTVSPTQLAEAAELRQVPMRTGSRLLQVALLAAKSLRSATRSNVSCTEVVVVDLVGLDPDDRQDQPRSPSRA